VSAPLFVPDASVILKWVLPPEDEPDAQAALALLDRWTAGDICLEAPAIWRYEVGNILTIKASARAPALMDGLLALDLGTEVDEQSLALAAVDLAARIARVTVYDAAYHALARMQGGTFVTADGEYFRRAEALGSICLLEDVRPDAV
jgi:predicted nucleic acid-binding protein